jgi:hypothetical protein
MSNSHEVISAFLDDRAFELEDLRAALEQRDGRALLLDLLALRRLVQPSDAVPAVPSARTRSRSWVRPAVAAAAVVTALAVGYLAGVKRAPAVAQSVAPPATRIVQVTSTSQDSPQGVRR